MGAAVAMAALIDDEGVAEPLRVDLVGAEQIDDIDLALLGAVEDRLDVPAPFARHEAEVEAGDARGGGVQHAEAIPAESGLTAPMAIAALAASASTAAPSGRASAAWPDDHERPLRAFDLFEERMRSARRAWRGSRGRRRDDRKHK